jgi:hypothetical protein
MKPDGVGSHSASVQSCFELFPGNCLDRARVQFRHPGFDLVPPRILDAFLGFGIHALDQKAHEAGTFFRIEFHRLFEQLPSRLCYAPVLSLCGLIAVPRTRLRHVFVALEPHQANAPNWMPSSVEHDASPNLKP